MTLAMEYALRIVLTSIGVESVGDALIRDRVCAQMLDLGMSS